MAATSDPIAVSLAGLAAWLESVEGVTRAIRGWPEREEDLALGEGAVVSVIAAGQPQIEPCAPVLAKSEDDDDGGLRVWWRTGALTFEIQMDVWAAYRAVRDDVVGALTAALHDDLPYRDGLELDLAEYHDQALGLVLVASVAEDDGQASGSREWRQRMMLRAELDILSQTRAPAQLTHVLQLTTELNAVEVEEPETEL